MGWGDFAAPAEAQAREAVQPYDGFGRYRQPKLFGGA
jgi:hypothetical protein